MIGADCLGTAAAVSNVRALPREARPYFAGGGGVKPGMLDGIGRFDGNPGGRADGSPEGIGNGNALCVAVGCGWGCGCWG
jgi:hypothetical protein